MRILIANYDLTRRGGTQLFVSDLARKLVELRHEPVVYSPALGVIAKELRAWTVPVTSDLRTITVAPDVIVGNYHLGTMTALQQFADVPAIVVCHGEGLAPKFPRIRRYVAVDRTCRDYLTSELGIDPNTIELILSSVDLARFPKRPSLPARPARAALFGNQFEDNQQLRAVRAACLEEGIATDVIGSGAGEVAAEPERLLRQYDLVFARARCALEAMATGAAVILTGPTRMGEMVTAANLDDHRPLNFGRRSLTTPIDVQSVRREIARYDAADAGEVCRRVRASASLDMAVAQIVRLAGEVIEEQRESERDISAEYAATASYLRDLEGAFSGATRLQRLRSHVLQWPLVGRVIARVATTVWRYAER